MLNWITPDRCDNSGPNCLEVATDPFTQARYLRDSTDPARQIVVPEASFAAFVDSVRAGQEF